MGVGDGGVFVDTMTISHVPVTSHGRGGAKLRRDLGIGGGRPRLQYSLAAMIFQTIFV
jgi:hypothetical protein